MGLTLRDVLKRKGSGVYRIGPSEMVVDAVKEMNDRGVGAVLVQRGGEIVGIFTERDVLRRVLAAGRNAATTPVWEVMTRRVVVVPVSMTIEAAMAVVTESRCRHLPVMDGHELCGMVSSGDLTRAISENQQFELEKLVEYITGKYPA